MNDWLPRVSYEYAYDDFHRLLSEKVMGSKFSGTDVRVASNSFAGAHPHAVKVTGDGLFVGRAGRT